MARPGKARCGTVSGYQKHFRNGEKPCDACARSKKEYDKRQKAAPENVLRSRLSARAQGRAQTRMRHLYPEVYAALYAEEKEKLYREAGLVPEAVRDY